MCFIIYLNAPGLLQQNAEGIRSKKKSISYNPGDWEFHDESTGVSMSEEAAFRFHVQSPFPASSMIWAVRSLWSFMYKETNPFTEISCSWLRSPNSHSLTPTNIILAQCLIVNTLREYAWDEMVVSHCEI